MDLTQGELLFLARRRAGLSIKEAAAQLGVGEYTYKAIEKGDRFASSIPKLDTPPTAKELQRIKRRRFMRTIREDNLLGR